jgi:hypothetical protein
VIQGTFSGVIATVREAMLSSYCYKSYQVML